MVPRVICNDPATVQLPQLHTHWRVTIPAAAWGSWRPPTLCPWDLLVAVAASVALKSLKKKQLGLLGLSPRLLAPELGLEIVLGQSAGERHPALRSGHSALLGSEAVLAVPCWWLSKISFG